MKLAWAAVFGLGLIGMAAVAAAQDSRPDTFNPSTPDISNPATKPIDETFQNPIPPQTEQAPTLDYGGLRPDYGREETYYFCSPCHSDVRIKVARKSRDDWAATIDRILKQYPYEPLDEQTREIILEYLSKQYGANVP